LPNATTYSGDQGRVRNEISNKKGKISKKIMSTIYIKLEPFNQGKEE
jgi:hypothetical protein